MELYQNNFSEQIVKCLLECSFLYTYYQAADCAKLTFNKSVLEFFIIVFYGFYFIWLEAMCFALFYQISSQKKLLADALSPWPFGFRNHIALKVSILHLTVFPANGSFLFVVLTALSIFAIAQLDGAAAAVLVELAERCRFRDGRRRLCRRLCDLRPRLLALKQNGNGPATPLLVRRLGVLHADAAEEQNCKDYTNRSNDDTNDEHEVLFEPLAFTLPQHCDALVYCWEVRRNWYRIHSHLSFHRNNDGGLDILAFGEWLRQFALDDERCWRNDAA